MLVTVGLSMIICEFMNDWVLLRALQSNQIFQVIWFHYDARKLDIIDLFQETEFGIFLSIY